MLNNNIDWNNIAILATDIANIEDLCDELLNVIEQYTIKKIINELGGNRMNNEKCFLCKKAMANSHCNIKVIVGDTIIIANCHEGCKNKLKLV